MKKNILIFCAAFAILHLTAFSYINPNNDKAVISCHKIAPPDLVYKVESRFMSRITKKDLLNAKSIIDILPKKATQSTEAYKNTSISILHRDNRVSIIYNNKAITELGNNSVLNAAQLKLLQSVDYSTNIRITSLCKKKNAITGKLEEYDLVYYMTIVPEKEATVIAGHDALINYLKKNSKAATVFITEDQLKPGKVSFTVTKKGTIAKVRIMSTSGYSFIDKTLVELINNMPQKWNAATNSKGEKVDQELIFFFGQQGC